MALKKPVPAAAPPSPWGKARDVEAEHEVKRDAVLRAAAQLFNERGFHATSLDDVAERLHITKPTLYYNIKNKDEILFKCVSRGLDMLRDAIRAVGQSGGTAQDKLVEAMRTKSRFAIWFVQTGLSPHRKNAVFRYLGQPVMPLR